MNKEDFLKNKSTSDMLFHEFIKCSKLIFAKVHSNKKFGFGEGHHHGRHSQQGMNRGKMFSKIGQGRLLAFLLEKDGIAQKELSDLLRIAPASVSELINKLEAGGFVEKKQYSEDKRVTNIFLTETGRSSAEIMEEDRAEIAKDVFASLDEEEQKQLLGLIHKVIDSIDEPEILECNGYNKEHQHRFHQHRGEGRRGEPNEGRGQRNRGRCQNCKQNS